MQPPFDLGKFVRNAEVRPVGRPMRAGAMRILVGLSALAAAAAVGTPGRAAAAGVSADLLGGPAAVRVTAMPNAFVVPRAPVVRQARRVAVVSEDDLMAAAGAALAGDAERERNPVVTAPQARAAPAFFGRASLPVAEPGVGDQLAGEPAPRSLEGVAYTARPNLHEHVLPRGKEIIEGGFSHRDFGGSRGNGLDASGRPVDPSIPDPSEAFMNVAVMAYMQNTAADWKAAAEAVERMHKLARQCVEDYGQHHQCSFGTAGVTFDYGLRQFSVRLTPAKVDGALLNRGGDTLVAVETPEGMYEGPAFGRVAAAEPEPAPATP